MKITVTVYEHHLEAAREHLRQCSDKAPTDREALVVLRSWALYGIEGEAKLHLEAKGDYVWRED